MCVREGEGEIEGWGARHTRTFSEREKERYVCHTYHRHARHEEKMAVKAVVVLKNAIGVGRHPLPLHQDVLETRDLVGRLLHV